MKVACDHHTRLYLQAHTDGRKIEYSLQDGSVEFTFRPKKGSKPYSVSMSPVQAVAVLAVQELEARDLPVTIGQLCTDLNLTIGVLKRVLDPLLIPGKCGPKVPCLLKPLIVKGPGLKAERREAGGLHPKDAVCINTNFHSRNARVTVPALPLVVKAKPKALHNRSYVIDATLVRVMKSRKTLKMHDLISEAARQIR